MFKLKIGGKWRTVPEEYLEQETEYARKEIEEWYGTGPGEEDYDEKRLAVIHKRAEFYEKVWLSQHEDMIDPEGPDHNKKEKT